MKRSTLATISGVFALSIIAMLAVAAPTNAVGETGADMSAGRKVFDALKCSMCHAVSSADIAAKMKVKKMQGPDLTGLGSRRESDWIAQYLRKEVQIEGKDHKKDFKGTDDDLKAMIDWMSSQN